MSILRDVTAVRKVIRNALRSRRTRAQLADRLSAPGVRPAPGSVEIAVYFADTKVNLYQIRQWYAPLAELASQHPVAIISRSPGAALALLDESPVPVVYCRRVTELEDFVEAQPLRLVLYVNQNQKNFQMFRYGRMWHVFVNHGESDKMYMVSNQHKSYDYAFVAGQAAIDRLSVRLWDFDAAKKLIPIGRPQADHFAGELPYPRDGRQVVLYAPTWEGDRPAASYGSIESHGEAIAHAVLRSADHRLVYRPHPRSGVNSASYRAAHERIVAAIAAANAADPAARHIYDDGPELGWQLADADLAITDISAMVYDRLATGKPLIVARPVSPDAEIDETGFLGACEWLSAAAASGILAVMERTLSDPELVARNRHWSEHHFGDTSPGAATARFHAAVDTLIQRWTEHAALHEGDRITHEHDPLDEEFDEEGLPLEVQDD